MKVGVFVGAMPPIAGGGFTISNDIVEALVKVEGKHTFVVFGNLAEDQRSRLTAKQIQVVPLLRHLPITFKSRLMTVASIFKKSLPILRNEIKVADCFQQTVCDLGIELIWFVTPHFLEVDVPFIFTIWDMQHRLQPWFPEVSSNGEWLRREKCYSTAIRRASAVVVGTEAGKTEIANFYGVPRDRIRLIPHPTPAFALNTSKDVSRDVLDKYHIPEGYLFYPAQFWPHKNHVGLLLALSLLRETHGLNLPVVFVGSDLGNLKHVRQTVDNLGLSSRVHFLGFVPREDMIGLYRNAFALTYVTFFGPENLPPLEAFALGCPIIASNVPGAQEQLGDAALLVDPKDEVQIADAIKRLYDDAILRDTLVARGIARVSKWTAEDYVRRVLSLIDDFEPIRRCWER